jgi:UDP-N-acetylmuramyl pentapeptide phosphotransferase/UDP-N-acetylglucosamine-1-phosphate transferase
MALAMTTVKFNLYTLLFALALCSCLAILWTLLRTGLAWRLATDIPNERSLHELPTPRVGGWGIVPVTVVGMLFAVPHLWLLAVCALFLAAISQIDDRRGLPARVRFVAHVAAVATIIAVYPAPVPWWVVVMIAIALVWLINLYNFMDGADGLAGGMAFFGFGGYALAAMMSSNPAHALAIACVIISGASAGFLMLNFHPARIFLGDAGSIPLGFLAGAVGYWGWRDAVWPWWFPAMVFAPFIADASFTLVRRLARGEKFWQAHREHFYQRMVRSGMSHAQTALCWYAVMLGGIALALVALGRSTAIQLSVVAIWAGVLILIGAVIDVRWYRFETYKSRRAER